MTLTKIGKQLKARNIELLIDEDDGYKYYVEDLSPTYPIKRTVYLKKNDVDEPVIKVVTEYSSEYRWFCNGYANAYKQDWEDTVVDHKFDTNHEVHFIDYNHDEWDYDIITQYIVDEFIKTHPFTLAYYQPSRHELDCVTENAIESYISTQLITTDEPGAIASFTRNEHDSLVVNISQYGKTDTETLTFKLSCSQFALPFSTPHIYHIHTDDLYKRFDKHPEANMDKVLQSVIGTGYTYSYVHDKERDRILISLRRTLEEVEPNWTVVDSIDWVVTLDGIYRQVTLHHYLPNPFPEGKGFMNAVKFETVKEDVPFKDLPSKTELNQEILNNVYQVAVHIATNYR